MYIIRVGWGGWWQLSRGCPQNPVFCNCYCLLLWEDGCCKLKMCWISALWEKWNIFLNPSYMTHGWRFAIAGLAPTTHQFFAQKSNPPSQILSQKHTGERWLWHFTPCPQLHSAFLNWERVLWKAKQIITKTNLKSTKNKLKRRKKNPLTKLTLT